MKNTFFAIIAIAGLAFAGNSFAQNNQASDTGRYRTHDLLTISNKGVRIEHTYDGERGRYMAERDSLRRDRKSFIVSFAMFDLGVNLLHDNTDYNSPSAMRYLKVAPPDRNSSLFDLRTGKSVNVNIYPCMVKFKALKKPAQRIYVATGIGLQVYNFRYDAPITYTKQPNTLFLDNITFKKDKLALTYLNVPLMFTFKTRIHRDYKGRTKNDEWLVYGCGITEGVLLNSWTKQVSHDRGKVKVHDQFGLADLNTCVTGEIGVEGIIRLFTSYQLTSMYGNGLDQHPISFGFRFGGI